MVLPSQVPIFSMMGSSQFLSLFSILSLLALRIKPSLLVDNVPIGPWTLPFVHLLNPNSLRATDRRVENPISKGIIASEPQVMENEVSPVNRRGVVRYVQRTSGSSSTHLPLASSNLFFSPLTITLLTASASPFPCGQARVEYLFLMLNSPQYLLKALISNWSPLSEIRVWGIPNLVTIFFHANFFASTSLILDNDSASTHFVN